MKLSFFERLYPFYKDENLDSQELAAKAVAEEMLGEEFLTIKRRVDDFFMELSQSDKALDLATECEDLISGINREREYGKLVAAILHSVKTCIYFEAGMDNEIQKEFQDSLYLMLLSDFKRPVGAETKRVINNDAIFYAKSIPGLVFDRLVKVLELNPENRSDNLSIPEVLAKSSVFLDQGRNKNEVRLIFHNLWEIERLKPLLTVCAYSALGKYIHQEYDPLQIIFNNEVVSENESLTLGVAPRFNDLIIVVTRAESKALECGKEEISGTIIHELHHFWERVKKGGYDSLPYREMASELEQTFSLMFEEAKNPFLQEKSVEVSDCVLGTFAQQPFKSFDGLSGYEQNNEVQHAEIVVRISQSLAEIILAGYDEEQAIQIIKDCGLNHCLDFFTKECEEMRDMVVELQRTFPDVRFAEAAFEERPSYMKYQSTPFHDAIRSRNLSQLRELFLDQKFDPSKRDSLGESPVKLAIRTDDPEIVFEFANSFPALKSLGSDLGALREVILYLFSKTKSEDVSVESRAKAILKNANIISSGFGMSRVFNEIRDEILDMKIVEKLKNKDATEIIEMIKNDKIPITDEIGNGLFRYFEASKIVRSDVVRIDDELKLREFYKKSSEELLLQITRPQTSVSSASTAAFLTAVQVSPELC